MSFVPCRLTTATWGRGRGTSRLTGTAPNVGKGVAGGTWDAWGHYHVMLGLLAWSEETHDENALRTAARIGDLFCQRFLGEQKPRLVDTGSTEMNLAPVHSLCLLYRATGETRYLELAKQIADEFAARDDSGKPLAGDYIQAADSHGVLSNAQTALGEPASDPRLGGVVLFDRRRPLPASRSSIGGGAS